MTWSIGKVLICMSKREVRTRHAKVNGNTEELNQLKVWGCNCERQTHKQTHKSKSATTIVNPMLLLLLLSLSFLLLLFLSEPANQKVDSDNRIGLQTSIAIIG